MRVVVRASARARVRLPCRHLGRHGLDGNRLGLGLLLSGGHGDRRPLDLIVVELLCLSGDEVLGLVRGRGRGRGSGVSRARARVRARVRVRVRVRG